MRYNSYYAKRKADPLGGVARKFDEEVGGDDDDDIVVM